MADSQRRPVRNPNAKWRPVSDEEIAVSLPGAEEETELNEVGARIWELCDGAHSVGEIAHALAEEFDVDEATAREDAEGFVQDLTRDGLLLGGDHA